MMKQMTEHLESWKPQGLRRVLLFTVATIVLVALMHPAVANASTGRPVLPVPYTTAAALAATLADPTAPPPGANDWSCKPSAAHPNPVVLVHGMGATMGANWNTMSPLLANTGYCVFALTYGRNPGEQYVGGMQAMETSSHELADLITRVRAETGAAKVDLVGHSEGTVMPQYYLKRLGGAPYVDKYVALTPLYEGTTLAGLNSGITALKTYLPALAGPIFQGAASFNAAFEEVLAGSRFLTGLYSDGVAAPGVTYTTIMTRYDEAVTPYTSGILNSPGTTNIVLQDQCPIDYGEHITVAFDPIAGRDILNALDPAHTQPIQCTLVLPGVGAPQAGTLGASS